MDREDIIKLAVEAGLVRAGDGWTEPHRCGLAEIEAFASLVSAHKAEVALAEAYRCGYQDGMEASAVICENLSGPLKNPLY
jgi:hypothetical protein